MLDPTPFEPEDIGRGEEDGREQPQRHIGEERSEDARTQPHHDVIDEPLQHGTAAEQMPRGARMPKVMNDGSLVSQLQNANGTKGAQHTQYSPRPRPQGY